MKIPALFASLAFLALAASAQADPSQNGLEHRKSEFSPTRTGKAYCVPEGGNSIVFLATALGSMLVIGALSRRVA